MPKAEWGTKRICPTTGKRFYDLNKSPIVSPYTGEVVDIESVRRKMAVAKQLRSIILGADRAIGEGIFWNAPTFYYTGAMKPFDPKTYKRYIVGFNFVKPDCVRLIFLRGADVKDP